jgi:hypothetical protein
MIPVDPGFFSETDFRTYSEKKVTDFKTKRNTAIFRFVDGTVLLFDYNVFGPGVVEIQFNLISRDRDRHQ